MSIKQLTVENAIIRTATVEVKTLTISGKQVTLAVFRQLPEKSIIEWSEEGRPIGLRGIAWGRVNYHPDKCENRDEDPGHFHVVWQERNTLYRARIEDWYFNAMERDGVGSLAHNRSIDRDQLHRDYKLLRAELARLDQLFIAV